MELIPVFYAMHLPDHIKDSLLEYYKETDHRPILNDSYSRFPHLFDFYDPDIEDDELQELEQWFLENGADGHAHVIIHWEW